MVAVLEERNTEFNLKIIATSALKVLIISKSIHDVAYANFGTHVSLLPDLDDLSVYHTCALVNPRYSKVCKHNNPGTN